jgi:hypothetical protein
MPAFFVFLTGAVAIEAKRTLSVSRFFTRIGVHPYPVRAGFRWKMLENRTNPPDFPDFVNRVTRYCRQRFNLG